MSNGLLHHIPVLVISSPCTVLSTSANHFGLNFCWHFAKFVLQCCFTTSIFDSFLAVSKWWCHPLQPYRDICLARIGRVEHIICFIGVAFYDLQEDLFPKTVSTSPNFEHDATHPPEFVRTTKIKMRCFSRRNTGGFRINLNFKTYLASSFYASQLYDCKYLNKHMLL